MTADELIASGYRLFWVTVSKEIPVLCKPDEVRSLDDAEQWAADEPDAFSASGYPMRASSRKASFVFAVIPRPISKATGRPSVSFSRRKRRLATRQMVLRFGA